MQRLTEKHILDVFRKEWNARVSSVLESASADIDAKVDVDGEQKIIISPGLKLRHKSSKFQYTVQGISKNDAVLRSPEGEDFLVSLAELENDYEVK